MLIVGVLTIVTIVGLVMLMREPSPQLAPENQPAAATAPVDTPPPPVQQGAPPTPPTTPIQTPQAAAARPAEPAPVPATEPLPPLPMVQFAPARPAQVVRAVYEFAARHPEVLRYVPCFCGCEQRGHEHNEECFVRSRDAQGRVSWEVHGMG